MLSKVLSVFLAAALLHPMLLAEQPGLPDAPSATQSKLKGDLNKYASEQKKVTLRLKDGGKVTGKVQSMGEENFLFMETKSGQSTRIDYANVTEVRKAGMRTGTKVLIGVGVAVGVSVAIAAIQCRGGTGCS